VATARSACALEIPETNSTPLPTRSKVWHPISSSHYRIFDDADRAENTPLPAKAAVLLPTSCTSVGSLRALPTAGRAQMPKIVDSYQTKSNISFSEISILRLREYRSWFCTFPPLRLPSQENQDPAQGACVLEFGDSNGCPE